MYLAQPTTRQLAVAAVLLSAAPSQSVGLSLAGLTTDVVVVQAVSLTHASSVTKT